MTSFIKSVDKAEWSAMENGWDEPVDEDGAKKTIAK